MRQWWSKRGSNSKLKRELCFNWVKESDRGGDMANLLTQTWLGCPIEQRREIITLKLSPFSSRKTTCDKLLPWTSCNISNYERCDTRLEILNSSRRLSFATRCVGDCAGHHLSSSPEPNQKSHKIRLNGRPRCVCLDLACYTSYRNVDFHCENIKHK